MAIVQTMSEGSAHGLLEMPCLGRPFQLGTLYDCRNDSLIPGVTLWGPDTLGTAKQTMMEGSDFEVITEDSLNEKTLHLDVSAGLKLSVLGGLVKAGGSGKFLYDRTTSKSQARVSLRFKSTSRFEQLNMSHLGQFEYPCVFEDDIATHVVTGVQYGADAFFVFDRQVDSTEKFRQIRGEMEAMISVLPSIDLQVGGSADLDIQSKGKKEIENIQCKFYGDFILPKNPTTYQDAVKVYQELPKLLGGAGYPNSVPKKVWLYPLSKLDSKVRRMVRDISSYLIDDLQEVMESLHELEVRINDLIRNEVCVYFEDIKCDLKKFKRLIGGYKVKTMKSLSTLLPKVRGGGEEEAKLAELLKTNRKSPFSYEQVSSWIKEKEREVSILAVYLEEVQDHKIQFAFQSDDMVRLTSGLAAANVLCFDFNIPAGNDAQLQRMENNYLHRRQVDQELQLQSPWYKSQELRQQLQRFVSFVTRNRKDSTCKYVVTNGHSGSQSSKLGVMVVFVDACPTEFEPPDQPGVPRASNKTHTSLQLSWDKPKYGSDSVQSYTVSYRSVVDPPDQWYTQQTSSEECLVLTKLTPGSLYHFKVTAESVAGSGPESRVVEERLPPDQPGKPETTMKTFNSLKLKWDKPEHGASTVKSYTIHYRSVDDPPDQWCTQTSSEECLVLTKLTPGSLYHFKVTAESAVGSSQKSMVGEERLPPDQPGKSQVTQKSHNSVQLQWEKPKHGAHIVQSYKFFHCSENEPDKWQSQQTNKQNVSLSGLTPGVMYYCKVIAQSVAGPSPASEETEVRLPPDQPGKPQATNKTHNSLQIKWTEPKHGSHIVCSYTVSYLSVDDHAKKWFKDTIITEQCLVLTKLTPGSLYHFKVTAESSVGSSPASEVGEERLPPDQPGKPNGSCATCNTVQLKWTPPQHGAETVQYYTISYQSLDSQCQSLKTTSKHECVTLGKLAAKTVYTFKVRAESAAGPGPESELSDPIKTLTPSLGKPEVSNVNYNSVQLSWEKPSEHVQVYTVLFFSAKDLTDPAGQWHGQVFSNNNCSVHLDGLLPSKTYFFKVRGETHEGASPESELSDAIVTKPIKPLGARLLSCCKRISADVNPHLYQLPLQYTMNKKGIAKVAVGAQSAAAVPHKVLLVVGATGAGKSTLINAMANYILGVDWEDEFRFKLISKETADYQTKSQTQCITAYTFHENTWSPLPYTLTVIDTPGFGDTGGLERDKEIVAQIKEFSIQGDEGIDQIHGIGFVTQAPLARLTPTQQYVFDSILSIFGKDVANNIFLMVNFADGSEPPVLDAVRAAGVPFKNHFNFNHSALFASNQANNEMFWRMGKKSFEDFFNLHLPKAQMTSLQQSREVLQEREQLETLIQEVETLNQTRLAKIDELQQEGELLKDFEADSVTNKNFTYQTLVTKQRKIDLPRGHNALNCLTCNYTCDDDCPYSGYDKYKSSAMNSPGSRNATCRVCPGKCSWKKHVINSYRYEYYQETETRTSDEIKARYDLAITRKGEVEAVMTKMKTELKEMDRAILLKKRQAKQSLQHSEEISLRPDHLTEVEYIDVLIESEEREACPGWIQRVKVLHKVRRRAEIVTDIRSTRDAYEFPQNQPEQQQLGLWSKFKSLWT